MFRRGQNNKLSVSYPCMDVHGRLSPTAKPPPPLEWHFTPPLPLFQLILDLDETLVHSSFKPVPGADYIMDIQVDSTYYKVNIYNI